MLVRRAIVTLVAWLLPAMELVGQQPDPHAALVTDLTAFVQLQLQDKRLPAVCIAVLDVDPASGVEWTWSKGFGELDPASHAPCPADAVHRVASISKLFTATAAMVLVGQGKLDLDAPVTKYLPEFAPQNPFGGAVTLRHLLSHRAGIVREPPVGHYFDDSDPGLEQTVASLNQTALVHAPGSAFKYSNPGAGVVGALVAKVTGKRFEDAVQELVLGPLGLRDSSFVARPELLARQPNGLMWTYDGRAIPTPGFPFGYAPAANLRSTVPDLVAFARSWFPASKQRVLPAAAQAAMFEVQGQPQQQAGCGLGFFVSRFDGELRVGHGGAVYGFASELVALPEKGLAVAVVCTVDFSNAVSEAIANRALRALLAARRGERLPAHVPPQPVGVERARQLAGRYRHGEKWFDLYERGGELVFDPCIGVATRMRATEDRFVSDDRVSVGSRQLRKVGEGRCNDGTADFVRDDTMPPPPPAELLPLLGEYGWDHDVLVVYEDGGKLSVLIEWLVRDQPVLESKDHWRFPPGLYGGDQLVFERSGAGKPVAVLVGGARFPRRPDFASGTFRITPQRPLAELRAEAARATPPVQPQGLRAPELVLLSALEPGLRFDVRYATTDNFLGTAVYEAPVAKMQRPAAEAVVAAHRALAAQGLGLLIHDAYRPWSVTKVFWEATPPALRQFVADPAQGSRHNRGCAVDLTLFELRTGEPVPMPSGYDEFTVRAYPDYPGGTTQQRWYRQRLRQAMAAAGFTVYEHEWWHFDFRDWQQYPVLDEPLQGR